MNQRVLISGAGISGLTLAYWLKKYGFTPTLIEKHSCLRTGGYKIDIRGSAVEVIKRMGVHSAIFDSRTDIKKALIVDDSGKVVSEESPDLTGVREKGDLEIARGKLCEILFHHIGEVECLFGDSIKSISQNEQEVQVEFEKSPTRVFDLVIGADGLHSNVRKLVFGEESQFLREFGLYVSFYTVPNFLHLDCVEIEYHTLNRFAILYSAKGDPKATAGFAFPSKTRIDLRNVPLQKQLLKEAFSKGGWEIPRILEFLNEADDFYLDCIAQIHMPHWTKGRVALTGDAGFAVSPISGQGASVALVSAYVLAGELAAMKGDHKRAFSEYETSLKDFVQKNQNLAKMSAALMEEKKSWFLKLSVKLFKFIPAGVIRFFKKLGLKRTTAAANAIQLKNYP